MDWPGDQTDFNGGIFGQKLRTRSRHQRADQGYRKQKDGDAQNSVKSSLQTPPQLGSLMPAFGTFGQNVPLVTIGAFNPPFIGGNGQLNEGMSTCPAVTGHAGCGHGFGFWGFYGHHMLREI